MDTIIIIDSCERDRDTASALLAGTYEIRCCADISEAIELAERDAPAAVLLDMASSKVDGRYDPIGTALNIGGGIVCAASAEATRQYALWRGASGFVEKPYEAGALREAVRLAAARGATRGQPTRGSAIDSPEHRPMLGESRAMRLVLDRIAKYAAHDAPVLILGESGTGKELAAAAIHRASSRKGKRFMPFDCAAVPEALVESYLFGTVRGAFTGSIDGKGLFESANGGTVFLDEIGELSLPVQAKFLRALETGCGSRVGSVEPVNYDFRIVSATNAALYDAPKRFRPELLNRIDTLVLTLPPLREHKEDIRILAEAFASEYRQGAAIDEAAIEKLVSWDWPGNVRELRNVVRRAVVLAEDSEVLGAEHIEIGPRARSAQGSLF